MIARAGRTLDLGIGALAAAQLGAAFVLASGGVALGVTCPSRAWLGVECPCCGMTRSFVALARGEPGAAFAAHPAGPALAAAMLLLVAAVVAAALRRATPMFDRRRFVAAVEVVVVTCLAAGVVHTF